MYCYTIYIEYTTPFDDGKSEGGEWEEGREILAEGVHCRGLSVSSAILSGVLKLKASPCHQLNIGFRAVHSTRLVKCCAAICIHLAIVYVRSFVRSFVH